MELIATKNDFVDFIAKQEADPRCGNLKLRDWLLSIIQRCPRYPLLLKDLVSYALIDDSEHVSLVTVHTLAPKSTFPLSPWLVTSDPSLVVLSLNTSLHNHARTLSLFAIQRSTPNLPFQFISLVLVCSSVVRSYRSKLRRLKRGSPSYFRIVSFCYEPKLNFNLFRFRELSPSNIANTTTSARGQRQEFPLAGCVSHLGARWRYEHLHALRTAISVAASTSPLQVVREMCVGVVLRRYNQAPHFNLMDSSTLLVSFLDFLYPRRYEERRLSQGRSGM